jgi:hypothetical protein
MSIKLYNEKMKQAMDDTQKRMFVKTDGAQESGQGTAMHSRQGKSTINKYKVFQGKNFGGEGLPESE